MKKLEILDAIVGCPELFLARTSATGPINVPLRKNVFLLCKK